MNPNAPDCALSGQPPYNCEGCDLSGRNLAGKDLRGANLKNTKLVGTIFRGARMDGADFSGCDLTHAVFGPQPTFGQNPAQPVILRGATVPYVLLGATWLALDLAGATITGMPDVIEQLRVTQCDVSGIDFSKKTLKNAHFNSVVAHKTIFSGATLDNIVFGRQSDGQLTDLTGVRFDGASINTGVFDDATLTDADFTNAKSLSNASFLDAKMDGTRFDHTNLTTCSFSAAPNWSREAGHITSFKGATLNYSTIGKEWSFLDLTGATLVGLDPSVDLTWLQARYAVLTGIVLSGYTLDHADFTGATLTGARFDRASMESVILRGVQGEKSVFDHAVLTWARFDLDGSTHSKLQSASFIGANLQRADVSDADFSPAGTGSDAASADFRNAQLDHLTAVRANFTRANLSGGISMHGASFAYATLAQADMTGAVLGALSNLFTITKGGSEYDQFLGFLNAAAGDGVKAIFGSHGVQLDSRPTILVTVAGDAWQVEDSGLSYTVLWVQASDGTQSLQVFTVAENAVLSGAFMPDAILTDANLIGVQADRIQLFKKINDKQLLGAIMYDIDLSNSILGSDSAIDISGAMLINAHLSGSFLINADMSGARLAGANLSGAQLQGAVFSDADLTSVNLTDAAVSILITSSNDVSYYGVPLFEVMLPNNALAELALFGRNDDDQPEYPLELATEGDDDYANLIADLNAGQLTRVRAALEAQPHSVTLSPRTTVQTVGGAQGAAWLLQDPTPPAGQAGEYTVWDGYDSLGIKAINVQPYARNLKNLFQDGYAVNLAWQTTIRPITSQAWVIDNDSENPSNLQTGYVQYLVMQQANTLAVFGTLIHATRLGSADQQEMAVLTFHDTVLCKQLPCDPRNTYLQSNTTCPNGASLSDNLHDRKTWAEMMQVAGRPPLPPPCVPSPYAPCPQT